jgi:hypothetical protein
MSAVCQDSALVLSLLDQMAEDDGTPALHFAASCGNTAKVETLITQEGARTSTSGAHTGRGRRCTTLHATERWRPHARCCS